MIKESDVIFLTDVAMPHFGVKLVGLSYSQSKKKWPDIWLGYDDMGTPIITVTREWARQSMHERRKRLIHELIHLIGQDHDESIGYSTYPDRDKYSMVIYRKMIGKRSKV